MMIPSGSTVKIVGLVSDTGKILNGQTGVVNHFSNERDRYAITLSGDDNDKDFKMIRESNLVVAETQENKKTDAAAAAAPVFENHDEMMNSLRAMGMPEQMLQNLTLQQKRTMFEMTQQQVILERAKQLAGVVDQPHEEGPLQDAGLYKWRDSGDTIYMEIIMKGDYDKQKGVTCTFGEDSIHLANAVADSQDTILKGTLFQKIVVPESKWEHDKEKGIVIVILKKRSAMRWLMVLR